MGWSERECTIIGGHGFIGSHLSKRLMTLGCQPKLFGRGDRLEDFLPLGTVFYCAGMTADYLESAGATVVSHASLLAEVLQTEAFDQVIYLSSTRLYDRFSPDQLTSENSDFPINPSQPRHLYDLTKLTGECLCQLVKSAPAHIARLSGVYSENFAKDGFMGTLLSKLAQTPRGGVVTIDSSPGISRDYVHIDDVVSALMLMSDRKGNEIYNVASGINISNQEISEIMKRRTGRFIEFTQREDAQQFASVDVSRLSEHFSFTPRDLESALDPWLDALSSQQ